MTAVHSGQREREREIWGIGRGAGMLGSKAAFECRYSALDRTAQTLQ